MPVLGFPNPVNEKAARSVAAGVLVLSVLSVVLGSTAGRGWLWLTVLLAYGFVARVAAGPTLSPLGQFATRVVAPRLGPPKPTAGAPKRFAQAIGASVTVAAVPLVAVHADVAVYVLLGMMIFFATLESVFGYCVGCKVFGLLMRAGVIPAEVCAECGDISARIGATQEASGTLAR